MTESLIERIARAIAADEGDEESNWKLYYTNARAAIKEIRDALPHGISRTILDQALEDD